MGAAILAMAMTLATQIELHAGDAPPPGDVLSVSAEGVTVGFPPSAPGTSAVGPFIPPVVIGWDRVRKLPPEWEKAGEPFRGLSDKAWRARTRVARADLAGAEPILEELHAAQAGLSGPTAATVGESLLRCRLARGAQTLAVAPWLTWLGSGVVENARPATRRTKDDTTELIAPPPSPTALDGLTGLVPALPPMWLDGAGVQAFARAKVPASGWSAPDASPARKKAVAMGLLYWQAARFECGLEVGSIESGSDDAGISLVQQIVLARAGDPAQRESARALLRARIKAHPEPWIEAWCRAALGRSLLREDAVELRRLGVVELLHVPARLNDQCPYLTGLAIAEAAVAMLKLGDRSGADRLRGELQETYTGHPALDWKPVMSWPAPPQKTPPRTTSPAGPAPAAPAPQGGA